MQWLGFAIKNETILCDSIIDLLVNELNNLEDKQVIDIVIVEYNVGGKGFFS